MHFSRHCSFRIYFFSCFPLELANIPRPLVQFFEISGLENWVNLKSSTIPFGIVAYTFSDNLSWNSCMYSLFNQAIFISKELQQDLRSKKIKPPNLNEE